MVRKILILLCCALLPQIMVAQSEQHIAIRPVLSENLNLPPEAAHTLEQKLMQLTVQNGFGATGGTFALTADIQILDRQVTKSAPAQYVMDLELSLWVVNLEEQIVVAESSIRLKAIERSEYKAWVRAINSINARSPQLRKFMKVARSQILDYYTVRIPKLIAQAQSLADRAEYDKALALLAGIPECVEEYALVAQKMSQIYIQMVDKFAMTSIQEAKAKLALKDYKSALEALVYVDPISTHFAEADQMIAQVYRQLNPEEKELLHETLLQAEEQHHTSETLESETARQQRIHEEAITLEKQVLENLTSEEQALLNDFLNKNKK